MILAQMHGPNDASVYGFVMTRLFSQTRERMRPPNKRTKFLEDEFHGIMFSGDRSPKKEIS